ADLSPNDKGQRLTLLRTQAVGSKFSITTLDRATYVLPEIDPCTDDTWTPTSTASAPAGRLGHTVVWTGSEMIVWGGSVGVGSFFNTGGKYCAAPPGPTPTPTPSPTPSATASPTPTPTPTPTPCDSGVIQNGGFETGDFTGWVIDGQ